jgi:hypothetical protein
MALGVLYRLISLKEESKAYEEYIGFLRFDEESHN